MWYPGVCGKVKGNKPQCVGMGQCVWLTQPICVQELKGITTNVYTGTERGVVELCRTVCVQNVRGGGGNNQRVATSELCKYNQTKVQPNQQEPQ